MLDRLRAGLARVQSLEDPHLLDRARQTVPVARLNEEARDAYELELELGAPADPNAVDRNVYLTKALLRWFKHEFFTWVDTLPCPSCGGATANAGSAPPSQTEAAQGAGVVELHRCSACDVAARFPRYASAAKLLETRRGRCGEWADCFVLCCRAVGLDARWVQDFTDHVWAEVFLEGRWQHADPCENILDTPLLYEDGWGKKLHFVFAFHRYGVADVARRYAPRRAERLRRRAEAGGGVAGDRLERMVAGVCEGLTLMARMPLAARSGARWRRPFGRSAPWLYDDIPPGDAAVRLLGDLVRRDAAEEGELQRSEGWVLGPSGWAEVARGARGGEAALPGRTTGAAEWRSARGEDGARASGGGGGVRPPGTPWVRADAPASRGGSVAGLRVRGSGENGAEGVRCLFDGRAETKWLDFGGGGAGGTAWVQAVLPKDRPAVALERYEIMSADDEPARDPARWRLEGCVDGPGAAGAAGPRWEELDVRKGVVFDKRHQVLSFDVANKGRACRMWRWRIEGTRDPRSANSVQASQLRLWAADAGGSVGVSPPSLENPFAALAVQPQAGPGAPRPGAGTEGGAARRGPDAT